QQLEEPRSILAEAIPLLCWEAPGGWDQWHERLSTVEVTYVERPSIDLAWYYRRVVDWAFGIMRQLPGSLRPIIPENVSDEKTAARAIDQVIHWCEVQLSTLPPTESPLAPAGPNRGEKDMLPAPKRARMTVEDANKKAMQLAKEKKQAFFLQ